MLVASVNECFEGVAAAGNMLPSPGEDESAVCHAAGKGLGAAGTDKSTDGLTV